MQIEDALGRSETWANGVRQAIEGAQFPSTSRHQLGASLLWLANEHQFAIHSLGEAGLFRPLLALLRPQLEACVRGTWILGVATDDEIHQFFNDERRLSFKALSDQLLKLPEYDNPMFKSLVSAYNRFCDHTHGGIVQAKSGVTPTALTSNVDPEYVALAIDVSVQAGFLSAHELCRFLDNASAVQEQVRELFKQCERTA